MTTQKLINIILLPKSGMQDTSPGAGDHVSERRLVSADVECESMLMQNSHFNDRAMPAFSMAPIMKATCSYVPYSAKENFLKEVNDLPIG